MAEADPRSSGTYRAALAAVIILSVLLVAGLVAVAAGFVRQYRLYQAHHAAPTAGRHPSGAAASVILAPGAHIVSAATDAGKLVLHVQTPAGRRGGCHGPRHRPADGTGEGRPEMKLVLPAALQEQIAREALAAFPRECCGLIEGVDGTGRLRAVALHPGAQSGGGGRPL